MIRAIFLFIFYWLSQVVFAQALKVGDVNCNYRLINYYFNPICPQYVNSTDSYTIDVDGDLMADIRINSLCGWYFANPFWINTSEMNINSPSGYEFVHSNLPTVSNQTIGTVLNNSLNWGGSGMCGTPSNIAFRKILLGDTIYGWLTLKGNFPGIVNSYAFKRTSDNLSPQPATITSLPASICIGDSLSLTANPTGGIFYGTGVSNNYFKSKNLSPGVYTISYVIPNYTACTTSPSSVAVMVNSRPTIYFIYSPAYICVDDTITLSATPIGGSLWSSGSGLVGNTFIASQAGLGTHTVSYSYTNTAGCSNTGNKLITVNSCVGINEIDNLNSQITIYPNPANDKVSISIDDFSNSNQYRFKLISLEGKELKSVELTDSKTEISLEDLSNGIYFVEIDVKESTLRKKLIIVR